MSVPASPSVARGIALMLATMFLFVSLDALAKYLAKSYPVAQVVWARNVAALLVIAVMMRGRRPAAVLRSARPGLQLARAVAMFGAMVFFFTALKYIPLAEAISIGFASPLILTALSVPVLGDKVGPHRWAAVVVGFLGVLVIIRPGGAAMHWAAFLALGMAFCSAGYQTVTRLLVRHDDALTTLAWTTTFGSIAASLAVPFFWTWPDASGWVLLGCLGVLGVGGHFFLIRAFENAAPSILAPFIYTQLIWSVALGWLVFGDLPDRWTVVGALIVVASGLYVFYREAVRRRQSSPGG